jgi:type I restriction enzyme S subunit
MGKTNPLNDADLAEFVELQKTQADSEKSWNVDAASIDAASYDLSVKNPNGGEAVIHRSPQAIMDEIAALDAESAEVIERVRVLQSDLAVKGDGWSSRSFEECVEDVKYTNKIQRKNFLEKGEYPIVSQEAEFINGYWNDSADVFQITRPVVVFGDHTQVLKYIDFNFVLGADGVKILSPKGFLHPKFFFYALRNTRLKSLGYARHYRLLKEQQISFPELLQQVEIVSTLDALDDETELLESIYRQKLAALDDLKKSLLHQAFSGQL